jgi:hypothetical protein
MLFMPRPAVARPATALGVAASPAAYARRFVERTRAFRGPVHIKAAKLFPVLISGRGKTRPPALQDLWCARFAKSGVLGNHLGERLRRGDVARLWPTDQHRGWYYSHSNSGDVLGRENATWQKKVGLGQHGCR